MEGIKQMRGLTKVLPVFEAGSNDGTFLAVLRERGFTKLLGLEPAQGAVTAARKLGVEPVRAYFTPTVARELAALFGQCDLFIMRQVLEHVTNHPYSPRRCA